MVFVAAEAVVGGDDVVFVSTRIKFRCGTFNLDA
jgi:hypothetical protein